MVLLPFYAASVLTPLVSTGIAYSALSVTSRYFSSFRILRQVDMETVNTSKRLAHLRTLMKEKKVDIYSEHTNIFVSAVRLD